MKGLRTLFISITIFIIFWGCLVAEDKKGKNIQSVTLDFDSGEVNPYSVIGLTQGQKLIVYIKNLKKSAAYSINVAGVKSDKPQESAQNRADDAGKVTKECTIIHDKRYVSYRIEVTEFKDGTKTDERNWDLPVETLKWQIAFSSAFVANTLTDPVFYLEPGVNPDAPGADKNGFYVKENSGAKDKIKLGLAAMVHLYHSKKFGNDTWKWAPVTFGLGFGEGTKMRYYLGTSLKMGDAFFLTTGVVAGQINRLPAQIKLATGENFTRESNILENLHTKTKVGYFLSLSYAFGGAKAKQILMKPFSNGAEAARTIMPAGNTGNSRGAGGETEPPEITDVEMKNPGQLNVIGKNLGRTSSSNGTVEYMLNGEKKSAEYSTTGKDIVVEDVTTERIILMLPPSFKYTKITGVSTEAIPLFKCDIPNPAGK